MDAHTDRMAWHRLSWLVGLTAMTGRVEPHRKPQSLLIYGNTGAGKTELVSRFKAEHGEVFNPNLVFMSNATTMGLQTILRELVPRGATHLVVPEFQSLLLKRNGVWETMLGTLLPAMEEGVYDVYVGPKRIAFNGARLGMIACMPTDAFFRNQESLSETGFLSRMLLVRFDRLGEQAKASRVRFNTGDKSELTKVDLELPASIDVTLPVDMKQMILEYAATVDAANVQREASRFEALSRAVAFTDHSRTVQVKHLAWLVQMEALWKN